MSFRLETTKKLKFIHKSSYILEPLQLGRVNLVVASDKKLIEYLLDLESTFRT